MRPHTHTCERKTAVYIAGNGDGKHETILRYITRARRPDINVLLTDAITYFRFLPLYHAPVASPSLTRTAVFLSLRYFAVRFVKPTPDGGLFSPSLEVPLSNFRPRVAAMRAQRVSLSNGQSAVSVGFIVPARVCRFIGF